MQSAQANNFTSKSACHGQLQSPLDVLILEFRVVDVLAAALLLCDVQGRHMPFKGHGQGLGQVHKDSCVHVAPVAAPAKQHLRAHNGGRDGSFLDVRSCGEDTVCCDWSELHGRQCRVSQNSTQ